MWWIPCVTDCPFLSIVAPLTDGELDRNEGNTRLEWFWSSGDAFESMINGDEHRPFLQR